MVIITQRAQVEEYDDDMIIATYRGQPATNHQQFKS